MLGSSNRRAAAWFSDSDFGPSGLFRISSFGFRILSKITIPLRNDSENPEAIFARALSARMKFPVRFAQPAAGDVRVDFRRRDAGMAQ